LSTRDGGGDHPRSEEAGKNFDSHSIDSVKHVPRTKTKVGLYINPQVADRFAELANKWDGSKGDIMEAAIDAFMKMSDAKQKSAMNAVMKRRVNAMYAEPKKGSRVSRKS